MTSPFRWSKQHDFCKLRNELSQKYFSEAHECKILPLVDTIMDFSLSEVQQCMFTISDVEKAKDIKNGSM